MAGLTSMKPDAFAARVVEWRDRYEEKQTANVDPARMNLAAKPVGRGKDGFRNVAELRWLKDVSEEDTAALEPMLTVGNPQGRLNVLEASSTVLMALPEMTQSLAGQVVALRSAPPATIADRIKVLLPKQHALTTTMRGTTFRVRAAVVAANGATRQVTVVLMKASTPDAPYFVIDWSP